MFCRWGLGKSKYSHNLPPKDAWTSPAFELGDDLVVHICPGCVSVRTAVHPRAYMLLYTGGIFQDGLVSSSSSSYGLTLSRN